MEVRISSLMVHTIKGSSGLFGIVVVWWFKIFFVYKYFKIYFLKNIIFNISTSK
jgi:hypothetical protein